jgi:hypothetical protein
LRRGDDPESQKNRETYANLDREPINEYRYQYSGDRTGYSGSRERSRYETGSHGMSGVGLGFWRRDDQGSFRNEPYRREDDSGRAGGYENRERRSYGDREGFRADRKERTGYSCETGGYAGNYGDRGGDRGGYGGFRGGRGGHGVFGGDRGGRGGGYGGGGYQEGLNLLIKMIIIS